MATILWRKWQRARHFVKRIMMLPYIFIYISIVIWLFPPFNNRKTAYFFFFYLLAVSDPIRIILHRGFHITNQFYEIFLSLLLVISLLQIKKHKILVAAFSIVLSVLILIFNISAYIAFVFSDIISFVLLCQVLLKLIDDVVQTKSLNLFLVLLLAYFVITIFKEIAVIANPNLGAVGFYLGGIFQMLFGLAFIFININTKSFKLVKE